MKQLLTDKRMLGYRLMDQYPDICCFSTTRHGGYSTGAYASFNCNHYCGDDLQNVQKNRELLLSLLPERPVMLLVPHQVHGTEILKVGKSFLAQGEDVRTSLLEGVDAMISDVAGVCLCISTADCIPVLLYDPKKKAAAVIHAGWRGTVKRIVRMTVKAMQREFGTESCDLVACIGPGISKQAFEVGPEVYEEFQQADFPMHDIAEMYKSSGKWHIDLWEANRLELIAAGVLPDQIEIAGICTYNTNDDFFSARRAGIHSGRMLSGILLKQ